MTPKRDAGFAHLHSCENGKLIAALCYDLSKRGEWKRAQAYAEQEKQRGRVVVITIASKP